MTPEEHVHSALSHLAGGRIFPDVAEVGTAKPYITYQRVGGEVMDFLSGDRPSKRNVRMQINVWAERRLEASELAMHVEDALCSVAALQVSVITEPVATYDAEVDLRGTLQDFMLFC